MAAQTGQPAISADLQWSSETPGPKPAVSMSVRRTPAGSRSPISASRDDRTLLHLSSADLRGPAPSEWIRIILLRASGLRGALHADQSQPLPAVLQSFLPSGFAAGDRTRTALAATGPMGTAAIHRQAVPRALSWLTGIFTVWRQSFESSLPRRGGRSGRAPGPTWSPRFLSPILACRR
jgi:hypothetical protein